VHRRAGPGAGGEIEFTNLDWQVSEGRLLAQFDRAVKADQRLRRPALACPLLEPEELRSSAQLRGAAEAPMWCGRRHGFGRRRSGPQRPARHPISTEGGHASVRALRRGRGRGLGAAEETGRAGVIERLLSGRGWFELYQALGEIDGVEASLADEKAGDGSRGRATPGRQELDRFCGFFGCGGPAIWR